MPSLDAVMFLNPATGGGRGAVRGAGDPRAGQAYGYIILPWASPPG
ncbi:hypothetical protein QJS66_10410 [Kocuria rhizophila]|nr:hypothetical protein QJS66_10410 [Kocuria rhizophila]